MFSFDLAGRISCPLSLNLYRDFKVLNGLMDGNAQLMPSGWNAINCHKIDRLAIFLGKVRIIGPSNCGI